MGFLFCWGLLDDFTAALVDFERHIFVTIGINNQNVLGFGKVLRVKFDVFIGRT